MKGCAKMKQKKKKGRHLCVAFFVMKYGKKRRVYLKYNSPAPDSVPLVQ